MVRMQAMLDRAPAAFRRVIADFRRESEEELFDSPEACVAWAKEHFAGLVSGELGGNLLSKYSMLGRFFVTPEAVDFLGQTIAQCLGLTDESESEELASVMSYLRSVLLHAPFARTLESAPPWTTGFDVEAWHQGGHARPLSTYRFAEPQVFATQVAPDKKALLITRIRTFGEHPSGLGKFTRTMFARDLRRAVRRRPSRQGVT
jgi:hypothetical protein